MEWYKQRFVNHRDWIIENMQFLNLSALEFTLLMIIDFYNQHNILITLEKLSQKMNLNSTDVDKLLSVLVSKKYLAIKVVDNKIIFDLEGLFQVDVAAQQDVLDSSLFELFEEEFNRPLSNNELMILSDLAKKYDQTLIIYALKEALMYQKSSLPYIVKILSDWEQRMIDQNKIKEKR